MVFDFAASDLRLNLSIDHQDAIANVSADAMANASKVWNEFIYPPFTLINDDEAQRKEARNRKELNLQEDDGEIMLLLIRLAHNDKDLPYQLSHPALHKLAGLCDKYDCFDLVKNVGALPYWLSADLFAITRDSMTTLMQLTTCWMFGLEREFEQIALRILKFVNIGGESGPKTSRVLFSQEVPEGLLGKFAWVL